MNTSKIIKNALLNAVLAVIYIALVATFLNNASKLFGEKDSVLSPIAFLITFVFSAAIMGIIVFGKPLLWFLDGLKKEAIKLVFYTLGFLFISLIIIFLLLLIK